MFFSNYNITKKSKNILQYKINSKLKISLFEKNNLFDDAILYLIFKHDYEVSLKFIIHFIKKTYIKNLKDKEIIFIFNYIIEIIEENKKYKTRYSLFQLLNELTQQNFMDCLLLSIFWYEKSLAQNELNQDKESNSYIGQAIYPPEYVAKLMLANTIKSILKETDGEPQMKNNNIIQPFYTLAKSYFSILR